MEIKPTKYQPGQKVWTLIGMKAEEKTIKGINISVDSDGVQKNYYYMLVTKEKECSSEAFASYSENELFPSKEEMRISVFGD